MSKHKAAPENSVPAAFMARRTVILSGEITRQSTSEAGQKMIALQALSADRINLIIDSNCGGADWALQLCDLMSTVMTAPVRGIALGSCGSAATFIMLYCNERISTPFSRFLIHSGTRNKISIPIGQSTSENLEQLLKDVKATEEMILGLYMNRLTPTAWDKQLPNDEIRRQHVHKLINRGDQSFDNWMSAEEAKKVGLITNIVQGKLDIFKD
jgi:ATP-dependent protease ClpP protease subunit